jgi:DNA-binding transcriptional ArsR family regulator
MGRGPLTEPQIPASFIRESFAIGANSGQLLRRDRPGADPGNYNARFAGESATYCDADGVLRTRLTFRGKRRTIAALRVAWIVATGAYPRGQVIAIGAEDDFRRGNLTVVPACSHKPQSAAGRASSLIRRQERDRALLAALAAHEGASIAKLARIASTSESRISTHLGKLAELGLTVSPICVPGRSWCLTGAGRDLAETGRPPLDDLDKQVLAVLRSAPMGPVRLSRRLGCCLLTAKRRARLLAERGLVLLDVRKFYAITPAGIGALGDEAPKRWVKPEAISASTAPDVASRGGLTGMSQTERSRLGGIARAKQMFGRREFDLTG